MIRTGSSSRYIASSGQDKNTSAKVAHDPVISYRQFPEWLGHWLLLCAMFGGAEHHHWKDSICAEKTVVSLHLAINLLSAFDSILLDAVITRYNTKENPLFQR
jgi:hypothetical protein